MRIVQSYINGGYPCPEGHGPVALADWFRTQVGLVCPECLEPKCWWTFLEIHRSQSVPWYKP